MADFLTPEQAQQLADKGFLNQDTARKFMSMPEEGPVMQPVSMPNVAAPEPIEAQPSVMDQAIMQGKEQLAQQDMARAEGAYAAIQKEEADLQQQLMADLTKVKPKDTGGVLGVSAGSFSPGKEPMTEEQVRAKYADKFAELEKRKSALGASYEGMQLAGYNEPPESDVQLVSDSQPQQPQVSPMQTAYEQQIAVLQGAADIGKAKAAEEGAYLAELKEQQKNQWQKEEADLAKQREEMDKKLLELNTKTAELSKNYVTRADVKDQYWANKDTGQKILAGIGLFLGAAGGSIGQGNTAVKTMNNIIDKDLASQQAAYESKRQGLKDQQTIYGQMMDVYKDKRLALHASKTASLELAQLELEGIKQKYRGQEIQNKADAAIAQLELEKQKSMSSFMSLASLQAGNEGGFNPLSLPKEYQERYIDGYGLAPSKQEAEKGRALVAAQLETKSILNKMANIRNEYGVEVLPTEASASGKSLSTQAKLAVKNLAELGVLAGPDMEILARLIPDDPTEMSLNTQAKIREAMGYLDRKVKSWMQSRGIRSGSTKEIREYSPEQRKQGGGVMKVNG